MTVVRLISTLALVAATWTGQPPFWLPGTLVGSRPTAVVRDFATGHLYVESCQAGIGPGGGDIIIHCDRPGCFEPCSVGPRPTLAEWCAALRSIPVPAKVHPSDPDAIYPLFQSQGTCP